MMVGDTQKMDGIDDAQNKLMEELRKSNKQVRSFDDVAQLLHVISSEQKARNLLRSCTDKVLMNMSDIQTLRDVLDRLRSVARTNGLRFSLLLEKVPTSCKISGDLFDVEIVLDGRDNQFVAPAILDVKVTYSKQMKSCPELVDIIRKGQFLELSKQLKALVQMFPMTMNIQTKTKVYLALQSLEADVTKMSQLYKDSHKEADSINVIMHGLVGLLAPPNMGQCYKLYYFLTPYDLLNVQTRNFEKSFNESDGEKGLHAEIRIISYSSSCILPIAPLISNNHPIAGSEQPRFSDINQHNSVSLPACFLLHLKPSVLIMQQTIVEIEKLTGMPLFDGDQDLQPYLSLIKKPDDAHELVFDEVKQQYNLNLDNVKACLVSEIIFTSPAHLVSILILLREQSYFNALFQSCIRPKKNAEKFETVRYFDVRMNKSNKLNITFQHPLSTKSSAYAEISLSGNGFLSCNLFTGRSDPPLCSDQYALTILQKSFSLPITMRAIMHQTKRNPRKEPDRHRSSRSSIYHHRATAPIIKKQPQPSIPVTSTLSVQQPVNVPTSSLPPTTTTLPPNPMFQSANLVQNILPQKNETVDSAKKESQHPMLTQLLKPPSVKAQNTTVQPKNHPMLMDLLQESENKSGAQLPPQQQQQQMLQQRNVYQQQYNDPQQHLPPPQYPPGNQMQYTQSQEQMPPPPSYQVQPAMKPPLQQQQQYQMQQHMGHYSNPSPLHLDHISGGLSQLPSFSPQGASSHSTTPPLYNMIPSPLTSPSPQPSPMTFTPSPRQPPMNTPQPLPMTSPRHATTPPMMSPSTLKMPVGRRVSRPKATLMDQGGFDLGFNTPPTFDALTESDSNSQMINLDVFSTGMSPAPGQQQNVQQQVASPAVTPGLPTHNQRHFSGDRTFNFSFESDGVDMELQRRNSYNRRTSHQPFMTPSPALSTNQDIQDSAFPMASPASSIDSFQPSSFTMSDTKPSFSDINPSNFTVKSEFTSSTDPPMLEMRSTSIKAEPPCDLVESDPFSFDDNKNLQKISMPDSTGSSLEQKRGSALSSRNSSISSNSGTEDASSSIKNLLSGNSSFSKVVKSEKLSNILPGKASANVGLQRRGSQDFLPSNVRSTDGNAQANAGKTLVRQNAIGKNSSSSTMRFQPLQSEGKEKTKKPRTVKDEKAPTKRRGRPPSTDKKEHPVKRKKTEGSGEDSEQRGKIVLNVQLNKGTPISSTTKTKPVPPEAPVEKSTTNSAGGSATAPNTNVETHKLNNLESFSPGIQQYFRAQSDLEKKKKEKKFASGSSSPLTTIPKNTVKSGTQSNTSLVSNSAAIRNQLASNKASGTPVGGNTKSTGVIHQKSGPISSQQQPKAAPRPRKNSIKDVIAMLEAQKSNQGQSPSNPASKRPAANSTFSKTVDRQPASDQSLKPKGILQNATKFGANQASKSSTASKPGGSNKSPGNHSIKQASAGSRPTVQAKREKSRPVTPLRDAKGAGTFAAALINQPLSNPTINKTSIKNRDPTSDSSSIQSKSGPLQTSDGIKRASHNRPQSSKSPRSITPPQARPSVPSGSAQAKSERFSDKKSPAHSADPVPSSADTIVGKRLPAQEPAAYPPPTKKANPSHEASTRETPQSPGDRLVIDDGNVDGGTKQANRMRTPTPTLIQPSSLPVNDFSALNPYVQMPYLPRTSLLPSDFSESPSCDLDDALMDEAVSKVSPDDS